MYFHMIKNTCYHCKEAFIQIFTPYYTISDVINRVKKCVHNLFIWQYHKQGKNWNDISVMDYVYMTFVTCFVCSPSLSGLNNLFFSSGYYKFRMDRIMKMKENLQRVTHFDGNKHTLSIYYHSLHCR